MYDDELKGMVRDTENEILAEVMGVEPHELPGGRSESFTDEEYHTGIEGWDSEPLDEKELIATNLYGHPDSGQDRPVQYQEDLNYLEQLQQRDAYIEQLQAHNAELAQRADPELQRRLAAEHEERIVQMIANPEQAAQQIYQEGLAAGRQASNINRNNASMAAAHRQYGKDFERAYDALQRLEPGNSVARGIVQGIMADEDPGQALLQWYEGYGSRGNQPPFMGGSRRAPSAFRSLNNSPGGNSDPFRPGSDYQAASNLSEEDDVLAYALER